MSQSDSTTDRGLRNQARPVTPTSNHRPEGGGLPRLPVSFQGVTDAHLGTTRA
jgi:hypothetical protein